MKTRKQPERRSTGARRSRAKPDLQIKPLSSWLQLKHQMQSSCSSSNPGQPRKNRKMKQQIQPGSVSTLCSSSLPGQLIKNREGHMSGTTHKWSVVEQEFVMGYLTDDKIAQYHTSRTQFYTNVAMAVNAHFEKKVDGYVHMTADTVRSRFDQYFILWQKSKSSTPMTKGASLSSNFIKKHTQTSDSLFKDTDTTSLSSVAPTKRKKYTLPTDADSALAYLNAHGCPDLDLYKYAALLKKPHVLVVFSIKKSYNDRKIFLDKLLKSGLLNDE